MGQDAINAGGVYMKTLEYGCKRVEEKLVRTDAVRAEAAAAGGKTFATEAKAQAYVASLAKAERQTKGMAMTDYVIVAENDAFSVHKVVGDLHKGHGDAYIAPSQAGKTMASLTIYDDVGDAEIPTLHAGRPTTLSNAVEKYGEQDF